MNKTFAVFLMILSINAIIFSQTADNDIPVRDLPNDVKAVLDKYIEILSNSENIDDCGTKFYEIAGGDLLNFDGSDLYRDLKSFSLKKDFSNIKYYAIPVKITRVNKKTNDYRGYEKTYIEGDTYKIWIAKKPGVNGLPAPVSILKPKNGKPKIVGIGSF
jgi:hypothetical protein